MRSTTLLLVACLLLTGCPSAEPETFDASLTFALARPVDGGPALLEEKAMVHLAVRKAGRKPLVDGWAEDVGDEGQYGRHNFPPGCTAEGIVAYYGTLLANAGWQEGVDYRPDVKAARIDFLGIAALDAGADSSRVVVMVTRREDRIR